MHTQAWKGLEGFTSKNDCRRTIRLWQYQIPFTHTWTSTLFELQDEKFFSTFQNCSLDGSTNGARRLLQSHLHSGPQIKSPQPSAGSIAPASQGNQRGYELLHCPVARSATALQAVIFSIFLRLSSGPASASPIRLLINEFALRLSFRRNFLLYFSH